MASSNSDSPTVTHTRMAFLTSLASGMANLVFARLYPSLRPYLPQSPTHLSNKTAIITGANSGIGLQIAKDLTCLGATVTLGCRNMQKGRDAVDEIVSLCPDAKGRVHLRELDTSSMDSVRNFAEEVKRKFGGSSRIDILVNNAGMGLPPPGATSQYSNEGYEILYATNFLGSFLLTYLLEGSLAEDARVVFTSSTGHYSGQFSSSFSTAEVKNQVEGGFHALGLGDTAAVSTRYVMTKSMQVAFAKILQEKWEQEAKMDGRLNRRTAHSFTPGYTSTAIFGKYEITSIRKEPIFAALKAWTAIATDVSEGAATGSWLASTNDEKVVGVGMGGGYWDRMVRCTSLPDRFGEDMLDRLWARWEADAGIEWR